MGVYLLLIASSDAVYRDQYNRYALAWMDSWGCKSAGFLAVLSCEVHNHTAGTRMENCFEKKPKNVKSTTFRLLGFFVCCAIFDVTSFTQQKRRDLGEAYRMFFLGLKISVPSSLYARN